MGIKVNLNKALHGLERQVQLNEDLIEIDGVLILDDNWTFTKECINVDVDMVVGGDL